MIRVPYRELLAEFSNCWLSAFAAHSGFGCSNMQGNDLDKRGVDVIVSAYGGFPAWSPNSALSGLREIELRFQLKATTKNFTTKHPNYLGFNLDNIPSYNELRKGAEIEEIERFKDFCEDAQHSPSMRAYILAVLQLPEDPAYWLKLKESTRQNGFDLTCLEGRMWWVSLLGAPETTNEHSITVYLPKKQVLTPDSLQDLAIRCSQNGIPKYENPESK